MDECIKHREAALKLASEASDLVSDIIFGFSPALREATLDEMLENCQQAMQKLAACMKEIELMTEQVKTAGRKKSAERR